VRVDKRRMALLRQMIGSFCLDPEPDEVEARSLLAFCVAIGHHSLAADTRAAPEPRSSFAPAI